ncbi:DUF3035 domain-containing protein [Thalassovita taeanensis]|uniref:Beta-barrel assembly machine subunit BamF n=1 Tax=Thalassovita taeanensis TaxID=657014 RepID=A0A1H9C6B3_9RHOB|nr:DUF3035 domain-containing protein [Thalassovita taeanensis]SEP96644.1 Beta-barrel assembly machine subunit BamF [Thalassovita taeanensis]
MRMPRALILIACVVLSACSGDGRDIRLRDMRSFSDGPDEFSILPNKALEAPADYAALPVPTPGGTNLTDRNPLGDAVAALGGKPSALIASGVPASDAALVSHASRSGVSADIRPTLVVEDEEFRRRKSRFTRIRLVRVDRYNDVYKRQSLDAHDEVDRFRRVGITTPSAPPGAR